MNRCITRTLIEYINMRISKYPEMTCTNKIYIRNHLTNFTIPSMPFFSVRFPIDLIPKVIQQNHIHNNNKYFFILTFIIDIISSTVFLTLFRMLMFNLYLTINTCIYLSVSIQFTAHCQYINDIANK